MVTGNVTITTSLMYIVAKLVVEIPSAMAIFKSQNLVWYITSDKYEITLAISKMYLQITYMYLYAIKKIINKSKTF